MITAAPGATIEVVTQFATGLTGTVGIRVRDNAGADTLPRTTAGIVEDIAGSGIYRKSLVAPTVAGQFTIVWDNGSGVYTVEELIVGYSATGVVPAANAYVSVADLKASLSLTGQTYADNDITNAINAACRGIDSATGRRFYLDPDATSVRYYTPDSLRLLMIDDIVTVTAVAVDRDGDGTFEETWTQGSSYVLEPLNAAADGRPWEQIRVRRVSGLWLPCHLEQSVKVTARFGWPAVPTDIATAAGILAAKLVRRVREAPFGIVTVGIDAGAAMRIARTDPDVAPLISPYTRHRPFL
jgi:hypothetical protein